MTISIAIAELRAYQEAMEKWANKRMVEEIELIYRTFGKPARDASDKFQKEYPALIKENPMPKLLEPYDNVIQPRDNPFDKIMTAEDRQKVADVIIGLCADLTVICNMRLGSIALVNETIDILDAPVKNYVTGGCREDKPNTVYGCPPTNPDSPSLRPLMPEDVPAFVADQPKESDQPF